VESTTRKILSRPGNRNRAKPNATNAAETTLPTVDQKVTTAEFQA
jgi:hypothetical protein